MESCSDAIKRKAVNIEGRLGSLYDTSTDRLVDKSCVKGIENSQFHVISDCQTIPSDDVHGIISLLKSIEIDDALLQSILLGVIKPSGISSIYNYSQPINENTCVLHYSHRSRDEKLRVTYGKADRIVSLPSDLKSATHMITEIVWGFEILCVIQNSNKQSADKVQNLLYHIINRIQNSDQTFQLTIGEKRHIAELTDVTVFGSETCVNDSSTSLLTVLTRIRDWENNTNLHHPILYKMCPLKWLYHHQNLPELRYLSNQDNSCTVQIEPMIAHLDDCLKLLKELFDDLPKNFTNYTIDRLLRDFWKQYAILLRNDEEFRKELRNMLVNVRRGIHQSKEITKIMSDKRYLSLRKPEIDGFCRKAQQWLNKIRLIKKLNDDQVTYIHVLDVFPSYCISMTKHELDAAFENYFCKEKNSVIIWCSSDRLERERPAEWNKTYSQLSSERRQAAQKTSLIYVDFSQYAQNLEDFIVSRLPKQSSSTPSPKHPREQSLQSASSPVRSSTRVVPTSTPIPHRKSAPVTEINVLLLGETGVGKSTFINAFVNYLLFDTLQQAEQSKPVVLIPVSFLITTGHHFDEVTVKFGDTDPNEDHEHQGQSVTQQCKSYVFHLNDSLLLRLIDTPGMGDTRGVAQDEKNINHILTYVNNLSHLNAICLLFKPNASRLNIFFRSCVNQLFTYLTPMSYDNIIFCFTNARSTFFAPGDTGALLRQMLKQEHHDDIPFQKKNTFCFDSESFRYLAARKRAVEFDEFQTQECIKSWTTSVTESVRLLRFIQTRKPYHLDEWQSPRKAALEISMFARPLMETLRMILYNWQLRDAGLLQKEMVIRTDPVTIEMCSNCAQHNIVSVGSFHIVEYGPVKNKTLKDCQCPFDESHFLIESIVKHDIAPQPKELATDQLERSFHNFLFKCDQLTHFLRQKELSNEDDPFTTVLRQFLEDQRYIAVNVNANLAMNKRVRDVLHSIKQIRQQNKQQLIKLNEKLSLKDVYKVIDELKNIKTVNEQVKCIKTSRQLKMEANERQVTIPSINNTRFAELTNYY